MSDNEITIEQAAHDLGLELRPNEVIQPGDLYLAKRHGPAKLLTCQSVNYEGGWIHPTTTDYAFDIGECVKVVEMSPLNKA